MDKWMDVNMCSMGFSFFVPTCSLLKMKQLLFCLLLIFLLMCCWTFSFCCSHIVTKSPSAALWNWGWLFSAAEKLTSEVLNWTIHVGQENRTLSLSILKTLCQGEGVFYNLPYWTFSFSSGLFIIFRKVGLFFSETWTGVHTSDNIFSFLGP